MINSVFPLFNAVDALLVPWLPVLLRVLLWGALTGVATLLLYAWVSDQAGLAVLKQRAKDLRREMLDPSLDRDAYMRLTKENLTTSFRLLRKSFGPAMISSIPVLIVLVWLSTYYSYERPPAGADVAVDFVPKNDAMQVSPADAFVKSGDGILLRIGAQPATVQFADAEGTVYEGAPDNPPTPVVHQRRWWNALLGNEAGYVRPNADVDEIHFGFPALNLFPSLPSWASTWELPFFVSLFVAALSIKIAFKIE